MERLERLLKQEKEKYECVHIPQSLKDTVKDTLSCLPEKKRNHIFLSKNMAAAVLIVIVTASILYFSIPQKAGTMIKYVINSLQERYSEKDIPPEKVVKPADDNIFTINPNHPVVFALKNKNGVFSNAQVIGGSRDGKWYKIDDFSIIDRNAGAEENSVDVELAKGGETYKFYSNSGLIGLVTGKKPTLSIPEATLQKILTTEIEPLKDNDNIIVGVNGEWDAMPRLLKPLRERGSYSVDLDGDGIDEGLKITESSYEKNDKLIEPSEVKITVKKPAETIYIASLTRDGTYTEEYKVFPMDVNGDGKLEIVIVTMGHNISAAVYEISSGKAVRVLSYYNGD